MKLGNLEALRLFVPLHFAMVYLLVQPLLLELESQPLADPYAQAHVHPAGSCHLPLLIVVCLSVRSYACVVALRGREEKKWSWVDQWAQPLATCIAGEL